MQRIPKKIHYIWFGRGSKSQLIQDCMATTRRTLPDWEILEWTEDNFDITACIYMQEAYDKKMYAFASDYARFWLLYKYGGVYLDTDVELLKAFPEDFLEKAGFTGVESNNKIAPGLVFACEARNPIVKEILDMYEADRFITEKGNINEKTVVERVTNIFKKHGFICNGEEQIIEGFHVFPCEFFCAYDFVTADFCVTDKTISIHHYTATWTDSKSRMKRKIQKLLRDTLGLNNYKKLIAIKRIIFGVYEE